MKFLNPIAVLVIITFIMGLFFLIKNNCTEVLLIFVLFVSSLTEITSIYLLSNAKSINLLYNISFFLHNTIWILILFNVFRNNFLRNIILLIYTLFVILNLFYFEKYSLNNMSFVFGALLYLFVFTSEIYKNLRIDNLDFLNKIEFILILAPVLFFFGFSFIFSFQNAEIRSVKIFGTIDLYTFIAHTINIIYYVTINFYIYKKRIVSR